MPLSSLEPILVIWWGWWLKSQKQKVESHWADLSRSLVLSRFAQLSPSVLSCAFFLFIIRLLSSSQVVVKFTIKQKNEIGWTIQQEKIDFRCFVYFVFLHPWHTNFNLVSRFYNWGIRWPPPCLPLVDRLLLCPPPLFPLVGGFIVISVFLALGLISKDRILEENC